jgi:hypothetical protein
VIRFKWKNIESCGVVKNLFNKNEFHVIGNFWNSSLSELSEMEIIGNIFFDLDKANIVDISRVAHLIGNYGIEGFENLNEIQKVKQFLSSKITPSFKRRKWFRFRLSRIWTII